MGGSHLSGGVRRERSGESVCCKYLQLTAGAQNWGCAGSKVSTTAILCLGQAQKIPPAHGPEVRRG